MQKNRSSCLFKVELENSDDFVPSHVSIAPNMKTFAICFETDIFIFDILSSKMIRQINSGSQNESVRSIGFSQSSDQISLVLKNRILNINLNNSLPIQETKLPEEACEFKYFLNNSSIVLFKGYGPRIGIWNNEKIQVEFRSPDDHIAHACLFDKDTQIFYWADTSKETLFGRNIESQTNCVAIYISDLFPLGMNIINSRYLLIHNKSSSSIFDLNQKSIIRLFNSYRLWSKRTMISLCKKSYFFIKLEIHESMKLVQIRQNCPFDIQIQYNFDKFVAVASHPLKTHFLMKYLSRQPIQNNIRANSSSCDQSESSKRYYTLKLDSNDNFINCSQINSLKRSFNSKSSMRVSLSNNQLYGILSFGKAMVLRCSHFRTPTRKRGFSVKKTSPDFSIDKCLI